MFCLFILRKSVNSVNLFSDRDISSTIKFGALYWQKMKKICFVVVLLVSYRSS